MYIYIPQIHVVNMIVHNNKIYSISILVVIFQVRRSVIASDTSQCSFWANGRRKKNKRHRSYLEESHHALQYTADNFGLSKTKH